MDTAVKAMQSGIHTPLVEADAEDWVYLLPIPVTYFNR